MRVTQNTNFETIRNTIHRSKGRMEEFQHQASTLKKLNQPSDGPVAASKVLEVRTDKVNNEQFATNARMAEAFLNNTDHVLSEVSEILTRAKEIAIGQSSGASSTAETRLGIAEEVSQLYQRAVAAANTKIGDRYLFGGYKTDRAPVSGEGAYQGDDGQMMIEVSKDIFVAMNVPGIEAFNTEPRSSSDGRRLYGTQELQRDEYQETQKARGPASEMEVGHRPYDPKKFERENVNVFDELQNLRIALLTGDLEGVRSTLDRFDQAHTNVVATRSRIGSRAAGLQNAIQSMERHNQTNSELTSQLEDADMAHVMSEIAKEDSVLRSVLSSSHRLVQPTLMDFLK
jgi:flagellar hook-associated protein 3 FlgL